MRLPRSILGKERIPDEREGFALIIAITLVSFVLLLLISLSAFIRVEVQISSDSLNQVKARQNALFGVMIATGQLQKYMGPDQRTSAFADIASSANGLGLPAEGTRYWTGVWGNANASGGIAEPVLLNWLISGNEGMQHDMALSGTNFGQIINPATNGALSLSPGNSSVSSLIDGVDAHHLVTIDGELARVLIGEGSAGSNTGDSERYVVAPLVAFEENSLSAGNRNGFAYWVGDEGVKARINQVNPWPQNTASGTEATIERGWSFMSAQRYAIEVMTGFDLLPSSAVPDNDIYNRVLLPSQLTLLDTNVLPEVLNARVHDVTTYSQNVLADSKQGGLKRDLTQILMPGGGGADEEDDRFIFPDATGFRGPSGDPFYINPPTWSMLRDFRSMGEVSGALESQTPTATRQGISPVLMYANASYTYRVSAPDTAGEQTVSAYISPMIILWNPYNQTLKAGDYEVGFQSPRYGTDKGVVTFTFRGDGPNPGDPEVENSVYFNLGSGAFETGIPVSQNRSFLRFLVRMDRDWEPGEAVYFGLSAGTSGTYTPGVNFLVPRTFRNRLNYSDEASLQISSTLVAAANTVELTMPMKNLGEAHMYLAEPGAGLTSGPTEAINPGANNKFYQWIGRIGTGSKYVDDYLTVAERSILNGSGTPPRPILAIELYHQLGINGDLTVPPLPVRWIANANPRAYMVSRTGLEQGAANQLVVNPTYFGYVTFQDQAQFIVESGFRYMQMVQNTSIQGSEAIVGNDYYNESYSPNYLVRPKLFDVPRNGQPLFSIADLRHAALSTQAVQPAYPVGNSLADFRLAMDEVYREVPQGYLDPVEGAAYGPAGQTLYDISYLLNEALWDKYYFSTLSSESVLPDKLPNSRYRYHKSDGDSLTKSDLEDPEGLRTAAHLILEGGFNINSTSVEAWKAFLAGTHGLEYDPKNPAGSSSAPLSFPFSRFRNPLEGSDKIAPGVANVKEYWGGYRQLEMDDISGLAERIVEEVRGRGPFLSVADFVNRSLDTGKFSTNEEEVYLLKGALQAAIDDEDGGARHKTDRINYAGSAPGGNGGGYHLARGAAYFGNAVVGNSNYNLKAYTGWNHGDPTITNNPFTLHGSFNASYVTQGDILGAVGSAITARSDTFVVRAYGETGGLLDDEVSGKAWVEAIIQRNPEYVSDEDEPWVAPSALQSHANQHFGRQFTIVSIRWLSPEEI